MGDVMLDPDEAIEGGGGLLPGVEDATLTFECTTFDYNGSIPVPAPVIHVHGEYTGEDGEDAEFDDYYSIGDASRFRPKKDGTRFETLVEGVKPTKDCKAMQLIASIVNANGGDKSIITANVKDLDGIVVDMERKPDKDRPGLVAKPGPVRQRTIMLVTQIKNLPGEAKPKKVAGKIAPKVAGKPVAGGKPRPNPARDRAIEAIVATLEANGGSIPLTDLPQLVFRKYKKDPDAKVITELAADEAFVKGEETSWAYDETDETVNVL